MEVDLRTVLFGRDQYRSSQGVLVAVVVSALIEMQGGYPRL
jgi:hypothetical protein